MPFGFEPELRQKVSRVEHEWFPPLDFSGLSDVVPPVPPAAISDRELRRVYLDALTDLHRLVEEYRFHGLLAFALLEDYRVKKDRGDAMPVDLGDPEFAGAPIPAEALVVLQKYSREPPAPDELFDEPHQQIAGGRIYSQWFAAQLLDSALYRGIAACDRLAILLHCRAQRPIPTNRHGIRIAPAFVTRDLDTLDDAYRGRLEWTALREIADRDDGIQALVKGLRNGFTHSRRIAAELHGEQPVVYDSLTEHETIEPVLSADDHWALVPAFYTHVLAPALSATRALVRSEPSRQTL